MVSQDFTNSWQAVRKQVNILSIVEEINIGLSSTLPIEIEDTDDECPLTSEGVDDESSHLSTTDTAESSYHDSDKDKPRVPTTIDDSCLKDFGPPPIIDKTWHRPYPQPPFSAAALAPNSFTPRTVTTNQMLGSLIPKIPTMINSMLSALTSTLPNVLTMMSKFIKRTYSKDGLQHFNKGLKDVSFDEGSIINVVASKKSTS